jgi:hypothetical protein
VNAGCRRADRPATRRSDNMAQNIVAPVPRG